MIQVKKISNETILVNGKEVYQDSNNNWLSREELTTSELRAFRNFINAENNSKARKIREKILQVELQPDSDAKFHLLQYLRKKLNEKI